MTNRITQYDAAEWLALLVSQRLIDSGEPVVAAYESMRNNPDLCRCEDEDEEHRDS